MTLPEYICMFIFLLESSSNQMLDLFKEVRIVVHMFGHKEF